MHFLKNILEQPGLSPAKHELFNFKSSRKQNKKRGAATAVSKGYTLRFVNIVAIITHKHLSGNFDLILARFGWEAALVKIVKVGVD